MKYPKFNGWASYFNKHGHQQVKSIHEGKLVYERKRN